LAALQHTVALLTGAENSVGRAIATRLSGAGAAVIPFRADPTEEAAWEETVASVLRDHGRLDLVVNAVQDFRRGPIVDTAVADFSRAFDRAGIAAFLGHKYPIGAMRRVKHPGVIITVTTVLARVAAADCAAACAAARGILMMSKSAALECAREKDGIIVSAVLAGRIDGDPAHFPDGRVLPTAPTVSAEDVAAGVLFLATDGAAYMTGVELPVDGGFLAT
jgi:NAD(P)-dependent dehydrogenase (short-subunit alcohol dehydrogenase family)